MLKKINLILIIAAIINFTAGAQNNSSGNNEELDETIAPKYSNEFLAIGVGARALGMSNAYVASVNDVTSAYWNPAGLNQVYCDRQVALMHSEYFAGIAKYDYAGLAAPIDATSTIAFSLIRFGVDDIPDTSELIDAEGNIHYDLIRSFSAADYAFLFSYAKKTVSDTVTTWLKGLSYGANVKVIHRKVGEFANAWGFGLDIGGQYVLGKWKFGAMARDITSTFNAWNFNTEKLEEVFTKTGNIIPENSLEITLPKLILGAGRKVNISDKIFMYSELNLDVTFDGMRNVFIKSDPVSIDPHLGLEFGYAGIVFLRAGIGNIQKITDFDGTKSTTLQPNMGVGVKIKFLTIDYALTNIGQAVGLYSNVFSLKFDINRRERDN
ncbi:MAG: PorV/PorQ family protein [Bacteroidota bacterium]